MESLPDRLPLVIGVTGHRDLRDQDVAKIEQQVAAVIAGLRRDYLGDDGETPIIVLSALAEGADRLVARVAIAHGARLIAPLPMPLDEYRRDFEPGLKAGNIAEFDALFAQAIAAPVMPLHGTSLEALRTDGKKRAEQYRAVGVFIAQHCHVLIALWDGDDTEMAAGGSAEVVTFKRRGIPLDVSGSARISLDASEVGPVIDIVTPRVKETSTTDQVSVRPWGKAVISRFRGGIARRVWRHVAEFGAHLARRDVEDERARLSPEDRRELETWESFEALIDLTRQFNRDAAALSKRPDGPSRMAQSVDYLFSDPEGGMVDGVDAKTHAMGLAPLWCRLYAIADTLALEQQSQFKWDWKLLFGFGFVAFFCFAMFTHAGHDQTRYSSAPIWRLSWCCSSCICAPCSGSIRSDISTTGPWPRRCGSRSIGSCSASARVIAMPRRARRSHDATVDANPVEMIANAYPIKQPSELAWVKVGLRTLERLDRAEGAPAHRIDPVGHAIARRYWVHGQFAYFKRQGYRHNSLAESNQAAADVLLLLSPFVLRAAAAARRRAQMERLRRQACRRHRRRLACREWRRRWPDMRSGSP